MDWLDWPTDYFPGSTDYPRFVGLGPGFGWNGKYAYLTSADTLPGLEVCRINYDGPAEDYETFNFGDAIHLDGILVGDDGTVYLTGRTIAEASLWSSVDDGDHWSRQGLPTPCGGLDTVSVLFQNPP